jgi:hypothetical protein
VIWYESCGQGSKETVPSRQRAAAANGRQCVCPPRCRRLCPQCCSPLTMALRALLRWYLPPLNPLQPIQGCRHLAEGRTSGGASCLLSAGGVVASCRCQRAAQADAPRLGGQMAACRSMCSAPPDRHASALNTDSNTTARKYRLNGHRRNILTHLTTSALLAARLYSGLRVPAHAHVWSITSGCLE